MKYFKHSLIFLLLLGSGTKIQAQELTKKIHKEIEVSKDALIEIDNSYGDLNITSWDQNKVVIDVLITVKGKNPEKNQKKSKKCSLKKNGLKAARGKSLLEEIKTPRPKNVIQLSNFTLQTGAPIPLEIG